MYTTQTLYQGVYQHPPVTLFIESAAPCPDYSTVFSIFAGDMAQSPEQSPS